MFNDSLPDGWGLLLMDRQLRKEGIDPHNSTPLDRLAWLGHRTMGALIYQPVTGPKSDAMLIDLHEMAPVRGDVKSLKGKHLRGRYRKTVGQTPSPWRARLRE